MSYNITCVLKTPGSASNDPESGKLISEMRMKIAEWMNPEKNLYKMEALYAVEPYAEDLFDWGYCMQKKGYTYLFII